MSLTDLTKLTIEELDEYISSHCSDNDDELKRIENLDVNDQKKFYAAMERGQWDVITRVAEWNIDKALELIVETGSEVENMSSFHYKKLSQIFGSKIAFMEAYKALQEDYF